MKPKVGRTVAVLLAGAGLLLSAVLEYVHVQTYLDVTADSFCRVGDSLDCAQVALSRFSVLWGIPMPVWGLVGFASMLAAAWKRSVLLLPLAAFSTLASILLLVEELVHVGSVCLLCEGVHLLALALLVVAWKTPDKRPVDRETLWNAVAIPGVILAATRLFIPPYWVFVLWTGGPPLPTGVTEDGHPWIGAEDAEFVLHEYVDYGCPHCAISSNLMKMKLVEGASARIVRRHQPRKLCTVRKPHTCLYIRAAACAGQQGKFWEMDSWLFAHVAGKAKVDVRPGAEILGLDLDAFDTCLEHDDTWEFAAAEAQHARKARIIDTPTYVVDGEKYDSKAARELVD